ncbi:MAG TPA: DUF1566 domain-containing protein [Gammaproteobacteria bacterium]|nr:DUF1566 domain-containing protein [Gammaproteobacteria bacterium]
MLSQAKFTPACSRLNKRAYFIFCLCLFFVVPPLNAQICRKGITPQTIALKNFDFSTPTVALDVLTGLKWDRCVYGQTWENSTCTGSPIKLTWKEALSVGANNNKRLPNIKELNTILDLQCAIPPVNLKIFPNTPASTENGLWSSTPYILEDTSITNAWYIDLGFGITTYRAVTTKNFVRFINKE